MTGTNPFEAARASFCGIHGSDPSGQAALQEGWVIANHILVSFHVAFISSVLAIPADLATRSEVLRFIFLSPETLASALFTYLVFHAAIALHELGHFLEAARLRALNESIQAGIEQKLSQPLPARLAYLAGLFLRIPYGRAVGVRKDGLNYYPDAPYNLAVAAAGPRASLRAALVALPVAGALIVPALMLEGHAALYAGRLFLGLGLVCGLDFLLADPGKYREFRQRERQASKAAESLGSTGGWNAKAAEARRRLVENSMQEATHPRLGAVRAPWQFRNCGMGGRHTEKEYPESNISMQEAMFLVLGAVNTQEAQEMTIRLQTRLKEILEKAEGCRVMGIGLEGGLAPYVDAGEYELPELRLWAMMKQAIEECGYRPGADVAIALDPALTELEIAYREEFNMPDSVGMYLFWRDHAKKVLDREAVLGIYRRAIEEYDIPVLSIEDGFSEFDHEGWRLLQAELGDRVLVVGDDLVTTNDRTIEKAAGGRLVNTALIKANQIGTLYETLLAVLVSLGKGLQLIVSHRSKSPNDDMEAHLALATNALGLKCGGGANTERLVKYQAVATQMDRVLNGETREPQRPEYATIERLTAREEPTNAGIPTVGVEVEVSVPGADEAHPVRLAFRGATPLGTSAGSGEAVHLVDRTFERAEFSEVWARHSPMLQEVEPGVLAFAASVTREAVDAAQNRDLSELYRRSTRYGGKGCMHAVDNVHAFTAPLFEKRNVAEWGLLDIDRSLLQLELSTARRREKIADGSDPAERVRLMQRKQNLGMNAILASSLAIARGVAHIRGQQLYELLREEMLVIIERLAAEHGVAIPGSRFEDYVDALRAVNGKLEAQGRSLHAALRAGTGIYDDPGEPFAAPAPQVGAPRGVAPAEAPFSMHERGLIQRLNRALLQGFAANGGDRDANAALRAYRAFLDAGGNDSAFEIANHRIFDSPQGLLIPYEAGGRIAVHRVSEGSDRVVATARLAHGALVTDRYLAELAGGAAGARDLWREMHRLDTAGMPSFRVTRLRDLAELLGRLNACGSQHEARHLLRNLVVRLHGGAQPGISGSKNLLPEIVRVRGELTSFLNGPFAPNLKLSVRTLVRSVSGLVSQPRLIDQLWQDSIDLAEVHVRGSDISNEIRRSAHHALGPNTLALARAYQRWLAGGSEAFSFDGRLAPAEADRLARDSAAAHELTSRIVSCLERLLGASQLAERIAEWRENYAADLLCCESSNSMEQELESLIEEGVRGGNRWVYLHRLRSLASKARGGSWDSGAAETFEKHMASMQVSLPDDKGFPAAEVERDLRLAVGEFSARLLHDHQEALFEQLDTLADCYRQELYFETFERSCGVRRELEDLVGDGVFESQRHLLQALDCILEELGYVALRHVAARYETQGFDLGQCLRIISLCAGNLERDGLFSRQILDLSVMLVNRIRTPGELLDVLTHLQRHYHRLVFRASEALEKMAAQQGFDPAGTRAMLGNFQRSLYDLNSLIQFVDLARTHVAENSALLERRVSSTRGEKPWDFVHLSHRDDIARRVGHWNGASLQARYGSKGSGLIYIAHLGIPTRDAFIIPTVLPRLDLHEKEQSRLEYELVRHLRVLEEDIRRNADTPVTLGEPREPLLLAVRGGSVFSMPGMLRTVVFVGMTEAVCHALAEEDEWFAWDAFRRFLASFAIAAWGFDLEELNLVEEAKQRHGVPLKTDLPGSAMREVAEASIEALRAAGHGELLDRVLHDAELQLKLSVYAVIGSWDSDRARRYRAIKHLSDGWHTAVIVQQMAAGNRSNSEELKPGMDEMNISLTGVIPHTRMTDAGVREFTGDVKFSACGDDLVGGLTGSASFEPVEELHARAPMLERRLTRASSRLRNFLGADVEIEFTVERGVLSVLQTRSAQLESQADPRTFAAPGEAAGSGIGIRGGAFRGLAAFGEADVDRLSGQVAESENVDGVLLLLENPVPDEIPLILSVDGLLAARGGSTSHAAVAIHGIDDRPFTAVLGVDLLRVGNGEARLVDSDGNVTHRVRAGDVLSIHGQTGEVFVGALPVVGAG